MIFEKFDTLGATITNIPILGTTNGETFGMVHVSGSTFIGSNIGSRFQKWDANGTVSPQYGNTAPDDIRGTAFLTCPRLISGTPSFCIGDSTQLSMSAGGTSYQWYRDGALISGATSQTYYAGTAGYYNCIISDACGTDSLAAAVHVQRFTLPVVSLSGNTNLCPGGSLALTGTSGGTSQWYYNGATIVGADSNIYAAMAAGVYNMTKTNLNGCTDSAAAGITVVNVTAPVVSLGADTAQCEGTVLLDAQNAGLSYMWTGGSTAQTLTVSTSGTYSVTVTDANSCSTTDAIVVTINSKPVVDLGNDTSFCTGSGIVLDAMNAGAAYVWSNAGSSTTQMLTVTSGGTYSVTVTDANSCSGTDTIVITENVLPVVDITAAADSVCDYGSLIALTVSPSGGMITGTGVTGSNFDPQLNGMGTFYPNYTYTDANGCSASDSVQIFVDLCTGIADAATAQFSMYPNPAGDQLSVDLSGLNSVVLLTVYDISGKLVMQQQLNGGTAVQVNISALENGIYVVNVSNGTSVSRQRLVVAK
jgi:hypothetical protein